MSRLYVTDLIGEDYKKWKQGDWVLLSYPTGMGKTHFILHMLLRHAAAQGKHLVYYCNRKFLSLQFDAIVKKQLLEELGEEGERLSYYLHVRTYQNAELTDSYPNVYNTKEGRYYHGDYEVTEFYVMYYVFDEAQYPVADSQVNPGTAFWLDKEEALLGCWGIRVFLTATPEPFLLFRKCLRSGLDDELLRTFLAKKYAKRIADRGGNPDHWVRYLSCRYIELKNQHAQAESDHRNVASSPYIPLWRTYDSMTSCVFLQQEIDKERELVIAECREPYRELYGLIEAAYSQRLTYHYRMDTSVSDYYNYVEERYFDEWAELADRIAMSAQQGERWLIFVRRKEDGEMLQAILQSRKCSAVTVNAKNTKSYDGRQVPRRSPRNRALEALVWRQELGCSVLVSTSVLDNGISLHADSVDHLVLCQPGKTSFLQMLGRVRVREGQRLNVYIQRQTPKQVKGYIDQCKKDILFLIRWKLNGKRVPRSMFNGNNRDIAFIPFIDETSALQRERLENEHRPKYLVSRKDGIEEANLLVIYQLLGNLYDMEVRAKAQGTEDPNFYLRHQLSWISKTYDPTHWVDYQQTQDGLMEYLGQLESSGQKIDKAGQTEFRRACLKLLQELRQPKPYFDSVKVRFSLERQVYPGLKVLNLVFEDARIPYRIRSRQPGKTKQGSRESYWTIEKRNEAKEAEHPLQDAPTLTDSQDTSGGSCSPSSGIPAG